MGGHHLVYVCIFCGVQDCEGIAAACIRPRGVGVGEKLYQWTWQSHIFADLDSPSLSNLFVSYILVTDCLLLALGFRIFLPSMERNDNKDELDEIKEAEVSLLKLDARGVPLVPQPSDYKTDPLVWLLTCVGVKSTKFPYRIGSPCTSITYYSYCAFLRSLCSVSKALLLNTPFRCPWWLISP